MKKLITSIFFLCTLIVSAQDPIVTGNPSNYSVIDENIEILFDVTNATDNTGTSLVGKDLFIWAFSSAGDANTNGDWTNIKAAAKLNKISDTKYSLKFPITDGDATYNTLAELFGTEASPGAISSIGYLLRDESPTFQTSDLSIPFTPFKFDEAEVRTFPSIATAKDIVMFRFNQDYSALSNLALTGAQNISVHITPTNNPSDAVDIKTYFDGKYFQAGIIPASTFETLYNAGTLQEVKYYFFDTDNPSIQSIEGSIILKTASN